MAELTFGEKAVGVKFNPSGNEVVDKVKKLYAEIIDVLHHERTETNMDGGGSERVRHLSVAITEAETAQMRAVKGLTWEVAKPDEDAE